MGKKQSYTIESDFEDLHGNEDDLTDLEVTNKNDPDRERVLSEAQDVETLISGAFLLW